MTKTKTKPEAEKVKSKKDIYLEAIASLPLVEMEIPFQFPIPLKNAVFVKRVTGKEGERMRTSKGGILLINSMEIADKTVVPNVGIVMAVGIECSEYLVPGQKVIFNRYAEESVMIYGEEYIRLNETTDIYGILPPESWIVPKLKGDRWLFREKRNMEMANAKVRHAAKDANDLDRITEEKKGRKNFILLPGNGGDA